MCRFAWDIGNIIMTIYNQWEYYVKYVISLLHEYIVYTTVQRVVSVSYNNNNEKKASRFQTGSDARLDSIRVSRRTKHKSI